MYHIEYLPHNVFRPPNQLTFKSKLRIHDIQYANTESSAMKKNRNQSPEHPNREPWNVKSAMQ